MYSCEALRRVMSVSAFRNHIMVRQSYELCFRIFQTNVCVCVSEIERGVPNYG